MAFNLSFLPFTPTADQQTFFSTFYNHLQQRHSKSCFILTGYAGTGKTSCIAALVRALPQLNYRYVLLAPTGRAAKVISAYASAPAYTIHKKIYRRGSAVSPQAAFQLVPNMHTNTVFIVDEASMISGDAPWGQPSLLSDLVKYVFNNKGCHLLFVGDTAQLPPVGAQESPALSTRHMSENFNLHISGTTLSQVVRQANQSGILYNATMLRNYLSSENYSSTPLLTTHGLADTHRILSTRLEEGLEYAYKTYGLENTIVITRSNKSAVMLNNYIRGRMLYKDEELSTGDKVMIVKNNYTWLPENEYTDFIANGDIGTITTIGEPYEKYGLRFANARIRLDDYPNLEAISCKLLVDTVQLPQPNLSRESHEALYQAVSSTHAHLPNKSARSKALKEDPYYNALQVKHAYAVTCHKAQGGQWDAVFVEQGYLTEDMLGIDFYRWLYTAVTRAKKRLFLLNFADVFFTAESAGDTGS